MKRFDDLHRFTRVVEAGGLSAAERAKGVPKSRLSRPICTRCIRHGKAPEGFQEQPQKALKPSQCFFQVTCNFPIACIPICDPEQNGHACNRKTQARLDTGANRSSA
jgi:hypothetical protein